MTELSASTASLAKHRPETTHESIDRFICRSLNSITIWYFSVSTRPFESINTAAMKVNRRYRRLPSLAVARGEPVGRYRLAHAFVCVEAIIIEFVLSLGDVRTVGDTERVVQTGACATTHTDVHTLSTK